MPSVKNLLALVILVAAIGAALYEENRSSPPPSEGPETTSNTAGSNPLRQAWEQGRSNLQTEGEAIVIKVLPDDLKGSRHQRFLLKFDWGQTILIAHNIDLAPRINGLKEGDSVAFFGEYEWNDKGGVIHWTHHDPQGRHPDGWLRHQGVVYQ